MTGALFVSPHLDDVALSCAGLVREHRERGDRVRVVTVFAGPPPDDLPIRALHRDLAPDGDLARLWRTRVAEDRAAMAVLGCEHEHLPFCDAVLRPETCAWDHVWAPPGVAANALVRPIADVLRALWHGSGRPPLYAPLAVGSHVDHALCCAAAEVLRRAGARVLYYEEYPYAADPGELARRLAGLPGATDRVVDVTAHIERRIAAARCYESQLPALFGSPAEVAARLREFAGLRSPAPGRYGERVWQR